MNEPLPKILIVDDKPNNLYALRRVLASLEIEIIEVDSGKGALVQVMKHDFFLVLLDVNMPDMDGFETADLMLSNKSSANIPIIFLTAINKEEHFSIKGYRAGAVDYICKPLNEEILIGKVKIFKKLWQQNILLARRNTELEALTTQLADADQQHAYDSLHDPLTGLANRKLLLDCGKRYIALAERAKGNFVLAILDLNDFKAINDTLGHRAGDLVLQEVSNRMMARLRNSDTLARIGGDEFCLILNQTSSVEAAMVIENLIEACDLPVEYEEHKVVVSGSFGIAEYPLHGSSVDDLLRKADIAMYDAKRSRRAFTVYDESIDPKNDLTINLRADLITAIKENQLEIYYQPQVDSNHQSAPGLEALVRWHHPDSRVLSPIDFIPFAEKNNMVSLITQWVIATAMEQCSSWIREGVINKVSVNVSPDDFSDSNVLDPEWIVNLMQSWDIPQGGLVMEVTENHLMGNSPRVEAQLRNLNENGIELSIDDFGTGYSSLTYLHQLPVKEVKIDQSFVKKLEHKNNFLIVKSIIDLGHNLGLRVVAEGVETEKQLDTLKGLGCDNLQGYYFANPQPAEGMDLWLRSYYETYSGSWLSKRSSHG
ncbi:MAG: diguanylate cyclase (GGDEF)-like protein [Polaribacter sp.]|jgi:diguanylate cyclase (GGDEF)-like protein